MNVARNFRRRTNSGLAAVWYVVIAAVLVVNVAVVLLLVLTRPGTPAPSGTKPTPPWSAVLLTDNEVFFGHIKSLTTDRIELTSVYFLQKGAQGSENSPLSIVSLVSNQVQCPKDDISINRANVLYWEDLQERSFVVERLNALQGTPQSCYTPSSASPSPAAN
jgi:hypothetical protein